MADRRMQQDVQHDEQQQHYRALVGKALFADRFTLDEFPVLADVPLVAQWAAAHPREFLPRGKALQALLRRAVADVVALCGEADNAGLTRVGEFAQLRYQQRWTVVAIARQWGCDRSSVHHRVAGRTLALVTRRFLQIVESSHWQAPARELSVKAS